MSITPWLVASRSSSLSLKRVKMERRTAKQAVLSKVNQVLMDSGLNDTVWSIRDCDSTLFVLVYKKLVGKVQRRARRRAFALTRAALG